MTLNPHQWRGLINSIPENTTGLRDRAIFHIMMNAALTPADIIKMPADALNVATISVPGGAVYKHHRLVDIGNHALDAIEEWMEASPHSEWLFCHARTGEQLDERSIGQIIKRRSERYGLAGRVTPNMLRAEGVKRMVARGMSDKQIAQTMGISLRAYTRTWA